MHSFTIAVIEWRVNFDATNSSAVVLMKERVLVLYNKRTKREKRVQMSSRLAWRTTSPNYN